jgi:DNA-binding PadR family transcriptional regulator
MIEPMKLAKDLVAASAAPLVLAILRNGGESYGYAIIGRVRELSGGRVRWTDGMLYPVLHRLETHGAITSRWRTADNGRRRKYYALSAAGRRALAAHKQQWELVNGMLADVWNRTEPNTEPNHVQPA